MRSVQPRSLPGSPPESLLTAKTERTVRISWVSMMTTKGVISTDPLGVAGRATCRPFGDGLVSTHPIPFGNISLTAKTERSTSPFHGLHDGDKGGGFNRPPFAWQAEPWLFAVSRVSMMTRTSVAFCDAGLHSLSHMRITSTSSQRPFCYNVTCYMLHVTIRWFHIAQDGLIENI